MVSGPSSLPESPTTKYSGAHSLICSGSPVTRFTQAVSIEAGSRSQVRLVVEPSTQTSSKTWDVVVLIGAS